MNTYDSQAELVSDKIRLDNVMNQASMPLQEWVSNNEYFNFLYQLGHPLLGTLENHSSSLLISLRHLTESGIRLC